MKARLMLLFVLILFFPIDGHCQTWEDMAQYTMRLESRIDSIDLWFNDSTKVEIRDYGINEFTIFHDMTSQSSYFIYKCSCNATSISLIGGRNRTSDFYRLKDITYRNEEWFITPFKTEIALSTQWSYIENIPRRKMNKRCFMPNN